MANIQTLPNELIFDILLYQQPPDLSNSSLTCRRMHSLAKPLLEEGQEITAYLSSRSSDHYIDLLRHVLTNPRFALYVTHLRIMNHYCNWEEFFSKGKPFMPNFAPLSERDLQLFRAVFAEQKEVFEAIGWEVENAMWSVEAGEPDLALMLLFCLLPRLSSLDVLNHAISPNVIDFVLAAAGAVMRDMKCPVALANLSSAFFQDGRTGDGIKYSFLLPWAALPALRTIGCYSLSEDDGPTDSLLGPELRDHLDVSPCLVVTDLRLEDSSVGTEALTYLLARTKGLKRFFYEHGGHAGSAEFVPSEIRDALL